MIMDACKEINNVKYCLSRNSATYLNSLQKCKEINGQLVAEKSYDLWNEIRSLAKQQTNVWTGFEYCRNQENMFRSKPSGNICQQLTSFKIAKNHVPNTKIKYVLVVDLKSKWKNQKPNAAARSEKSKRHFVCQMSESSKSSTPVNKRIPISTTTSFTSTHKATAVANHTNPGLIVFLVFFFLILFSLIAFLYFNKRGNRWCRRKKDFLMRNYEYYFGKFEFPSRTSSNIERNPQNVSPDAAPIEQNLPHISPTLQRHCSFASFDSMTSDDRSEDNCIDKKSITESENPEETYNEIDLQQKEQSSEVDIYATITKTLKREPAAE